MSYCKSQSCIRDEKIFIEKFNKIIGEKYSMIGMGTLFYSISTLPFSARTLNNSYNIKVFIIRFFNKIYEDYKDNFYKLTQEQKNYYRDLINNKWNAKFNLLLDKILIELEDSDANINNINTIISKVNNLYNAFKRHTIY